MIITEIIRRNKLLDKDVLNIEERDEPTTFVMTVEE